MKCQRCGQCCTSASIALFNIPADEDRKELGKWLENHHCRIETVGTSEGNKLAVRIPLICKYLKYDDKGLGSCEIYENRPIICQEYWCKRLR